MWGTTGHKLGCSSSGPAGYAYLALLCVEHIDTSLVEYVCRPSGYLSSTANLMELTYGKPPGGGQQLYVGRYLPRYMYIHTKAKHMDEHCTTVLLCVPPSRGMSKTHGPGATLAGFGCASVAQFGPPTTYRVGGIG